MQAPRISPRAHLVQRSGDRDVVEEGVDGVRVRVRKWQAPGQGAQEVTGGRNRARTCGLSLVRAALSRLSYPPVPSRLGSCAAGVNGEGLSMPGSMPVSG